MNVCLVFSIIALIVLKVSSAYSNDDLTFKLNI